MWLMTLNNYNRQLTLRIASMNLYYIFKFIINENWQLILFLKPIPI